MINLKMFKNEIEDYDFVVRERPIIKYNINKKIESFKDEGTDLILCFEYDINNNLTRITENYNGEILKQKFSENGKLIYIEIHNEEGCDDNIIEYHNNGNISSIINNFKFDAYGNFIWFGYRDTSYFYNDAGDIVKIISDDEYFGKYIWEYDSDGNLIRYNSYEEEYTFEYSENNIQCVIKLEGEIQVKCIYDKNTKDIEYEEGN